MDAPGITYAFAVPKDTAGPTFEILSRHLQSSVSASLIELFVGELAKDRILILQSITVAADPGAGQTVTEIAIQGITQAGLNFSIARKLPQKVSGQSEDLNWTGAVWIQGGGSGTNSVRVFAAFGSPTNANLVTAGVAGIVIPRGNAGAF